MHFDFWNNKKRAAEKASREKFLKREQEKRVKRTERNLSKSAAINTQSLGLLSETIKNGEAFQQKVEDFNEQVLDFQITVEENKKLQQQLQEEQSRLSAWEEDLKNRAEAIRKEEMTLHIRGESLKKDEQRVAKKDKDLESERQNIKDEHKEMKARESKAEQAEKKYTEQKEAYFEKQKSVDEEKRKVEEKLKDLDSREEKCRNKEEEINKRLSEVTEKERTFSAKEKSRMTSFDKEKERWEKDRAEIENTLEEKIKEYDRKMADMEAASETIDSIKYDDSEDGKRAKIVVKETIRMAMKTLEDNLQKFKELDEKYASGSFKGFSIPIDEISIVNEELKSQYEAVKEHAESTGLDFSIWLEKIENAILEADKNFKSFFFAECYRNAIEGLSYCKGYSDIINILNEYAGSAEGTSDDGAETSADSEEAEWENYYEFFFEDKYDCDFDYSQMSENVLKKQYRKMAKKYHPDTAEDKDKDEFTAITIHLNKIWEVLSDSEKRAEYDRTYLENRDSRKAA